MNQDKIWDYYQNEAPESFSGGISRQEFLVAIIKKLDLQNKNVLNIGVGSGSFEQFATNAGLNVFSLDPSEKSINTLKEKLGMGDRAKIGFGEKNPFENDFFDVVVISEVLEHLSDEVLDKTLYEIKRVLVDGGHIIGTVPARENLALQVVICPHCGEKFHRWGHAQSFDLNRAKKLLSGKFKSVVVFEKMFVRWEDLNWKGKMHAFIKLVLHIIGSRGSNENIVFIAEK